MTTSNQLTEQECTVLSLVARGWRNAAITRELFISTRTVEGHIYHIFDKLGVSSRTEAALAVLQNSSILNTEISRNSGDSRHSNSYAMDMS